MQSIRSVYKIGHGPSSSHTVGPYNAAKIFRKRHPEADAFRVTLYGSLAFTGAGHGTGKAILSGLPGAEILTDTKTGINDLPHPNTMLFEALEDGEVIDSVAVPSGSRMNRTRRRRKSIRRRTWRRCWTSAGKKN